MILFNLFHSKITAVYELGLKWKDSFTVNPNLKFEPGQKLTQSEREILILEQG